MNNLFSKSTGTYEKLIQQLETILTEQRHQRIDLATIKRMNDKIINLLKLQKQVDDYFEDKEHDLDGSDTGYPDSEPSKESIPDL